MAGRRTSLALALTVVGLGAATGAGSGSRLLLPVLAGSRLGEALP